MRQRPKRRYSFAQYGQSEQNQKHGNYLLKAGGADLWSPAYEAGVTTIRVLPVKHPDTPTQFDPYRFPSTDPDEALCFGDWIRRYPAVRKMGEPAVTFIQYDPEDPEIEDVQMTPAWMLYRAIDSAVQRGTDRPGWAALLRGSRGKSAQLPRPSEVYLVQCLVVQYKNRAYNPPKGFGQDDKVCVMEMGPSAGLAMVNEFHREVEGFNGDPDDFEARYVCGDPISLDTGRFVNFYSLSEGDPRRTQASAAAPQTWNMGGGQRGLGGSDEKKPIGFGCFVEPAFGAMPARLREYEGLVAARVKMWDDILRKPTIAEQASLLETKFPPDVIEYAWASNPEWISEDTRRKARGAVQATMPINMPGGHPQYNQYQQTGPMPTAPAGYAPPYQPPAPVQQAPPSYAPPQQQPAPPQQQAPWEQPSAAMPAAPRQPAPQQAAYQPQAPAAMGWMAAGNDAQQPAPQAPLAAVEPDPATPNWAIPAQSADLPEPPSMPAQAAPPAATPSPTAQQAAPSMPAQAAQPAATPTALTTQPTQQSFDPPPAAPVDPGAAALARAQAAAARLAANRQAM